MKRVIMDLLLYLETEGESFLFHTKFEGFWVIISTDGGGVKVYCTLFKSGVCLH